MPLIYRSQCHPKPKIVVRSNKSGGFLKKEDFCEGLDLWLIRVVYTLPKVKVTDRSHKFSGYLQKKNKIVLTNHIQLS